MRFLRLALLPVLAACSLDSGVDIADPVSLEEQQWGSSLQIDLTAMTKLASGVYIQDKTVGTGDAVSGSPTIRFFYTVFLASGAQVESNVGGTAAEYALASLIPGWNSGLQGMKVGGKRRLLVPSSLAYGSEGAGAIPPNANLVFDVDLVLIR